VTKWEYVNFFVFGIRFWDFELWYFLKLMVLFEIIL
jgi:hypothetical protein